MRLRRKKNSVKPYYGPESVGFDLTSHIYTTCDMLQPAVLTKVEQLLDESSIAQVARLDTTDPCRKRVTRFRNGLRTLLQDNSDTDDLWIFGNNKAGSSFDTMFRLRKEGVILPLCGYDQGYSRVMFSIKRMELGEVEIANFRDLFTKICDTIGAFYGQAADGSMYRQRNMLLDEAAEDILISRKYPDFSRELPDIYWLNYFGPGYVKFWGQSKIDALQKEYKIARVGSGGIYVESTPEPTIADANVKHMQDYKWKKCFYDILGQNTFMTETQEQGEPGQYVPTLADHRQILKQP